MVEASPTQLTEAEAEVYDRQIRLWGIEAQTRLRNARVLVIGMDGLGAEIVKNVVLTGVKSVVMLDHNMVTEADLKNQFFISPSCIGQNRAETSLAKAQILNPLVAITFDKQPVTEKPTDFFTENFDVVISCNQPISFNIELNSKFRTDKKAFYACSVYGTFGYVFIDLKTHSYTMETSVATLCGNIIRTSFETDHFPEMKVALEADTNAPDFVRRLRKAPASFFILKALQKFQEDHGRDPTSSEDDFLALLAIRDSIFENSVVPKDRLPDEVFRCLTMGMPNPCCAIVGAIVAQDMVKAVSCKGIPIRNFFFFDPISLGGYIQYLGPKHNDSTTS